MCARALEDLAKEYPQSFVRHLDFLAEEDPAQQSMEKRFTRWKYGRGLQNEDLTPREYNIFRAARRLV